MVALFAESTIRCPPGQGRGTCRRWGRGRGARGLVGLGGVQVGLVGLWGVQVALEGLKVVQVAPLGRGGARSAQCHMTKLQQPYKIISQ